jgi:hypothetical protein
VYRARRLVICHFWAALLCFAPAIVLGVWQMLMWNAILLALMVLSYGYPIGQFFFLRTHAPPGYSLTEEPRR